MISNDTVSEKIDLGDGDADNEWTTYAGQRVPRKKHDPNGESSKGRRDGEERWGKQTRVLNHNVCYIIHERKKRTSFSFL